MINRKTVTLIINLISFECSLLVMYMLIHFIRNQNNLYLDRDWFFVTIFNNSLYLYLSVLNILIYPIISYTYKIRTKIRNGYKISFFMSFITTIIPLLVTYLFIYIICPLNRLNIIFIITEMKLDFAQFGYLDYLFWNRPLFHNLLAMFIVSLLNGLIGLISYKYWRRSHILLGVPLIVFLMEYIFLNPKFIIQSHFFNNTFKPYQSEDFLTAFIIFGFSYFLLWFCLNFKKNYISLSNKLVVAIKSISFNLLIRSFLISMLIISIQFKRQRYLILMDMYKEIPKQIVFFKMFCNFELFSESGPNVSELMPFFLLFIYLVYEIGQVFYHYMGDNLIYTITRYSSRIDWLKEVYRNIILRVLIITTVYVSELIFLCLYNDIDIPLNIYFILWVIINLILLFYANLFLLLSLMVNLKFGVLFINIYLSLEMIMIISFRTISDNFSIPFTLIRYFPMMSLFLNFYHTSYFIGEFPIQFNTLMFHIGEICILLVLAIIFQYKMFYRFLNYYRD